MSVRSSGACERLPSRSTHTGTAVPTGVLGSTRTSPSRVVPPGPDHMALAVTVGSEESPKSPADRGGRGASSSSTAWVSVRSAASVAATASRRVVVESTTATASRGAKKNDRTTTTRPNTWMRSDPRLSGPDPRVNARRNRRYPLSSCEAMGIAPSAMRVGTGAVASGEDASLQLVELGLADRPLVQQFLAAGDVVDAAE